MTVRDLAIQPVQRAMRYVLKYRGASSSVSVLVVGCRRAHVLLSADLLDHTPAASPSRPLVERAYESALRIAKNTDRAQAHAAFLRQTAHKSEKSSPRSPVKTS